MPKIFIQNENAAAVAQQYMLFHNQGNDGLAIRATGGLSGSNQQRRAALARTYDAATTPEAKQAALDAIVFYTFQKAVVDAARRGEYEIEQPENYAQYAQQALATARNYAAQEARAEREAETAREAAAERTRRANRTPQERALDQHFSSTRGEPVAPNSSRGRVIAILNQYYNNLPANITGEARYNRARNAIDNALETEDTSFWTSSDRERSLKTARRVLDEQQEIERAQAAARRAERPQPAQPAAPAAPAAEQPAGRRAPLSEEQALTLAVNEILGASGAGLMNPEFSRDHDAIRARVMQMLGESQGFLNASQQERDALYNDLLQVFNRRPVTTEVRAAGYTLNILMRAVDHNKAHVLGRPALPRLNRETYLALSADNEEYARNPAAWRQEHNPEDRAAGAGAAGEGAGGEGAGPETGGAPVEGASGGRGWTPIDKSVQFDLEALGLDTGQPRGWDASQGAEAMDGKNGRRTRAAIEQFRASKPEYAEMTDEQLFAALRTEAEAARAGQGQGQPAAETGGQGQAAGGLNADVVQAANALMAGQTEDALDFRTAAVNGVMDGVTDSMILGQLPTKLAPYQLTASEMSSIRVANGVVSSEFLQAAERLLGLNADGMLDGKLQAALNDATVRTAVLAAVRSGAGAAASVDSASPQNAPVGNGGQGTGR